MPIREQQITNKQHAIPQSIMSVEFKIIGDLTLKQFFYLMGFGVLAYVCFMLIPTFVFKWFLVIISAGLGLCFAFLVLGDRGMDVWLINFLRAMFLPNQFVYRKEEEIPVVFLYQNLDVLKSELITLTPTSSRREIEAYLEQQSAPVDKLDIDEKSYILKVKEAYSRTGWGSGPSGAPPAITTTTIEVTGEEPAPQPAAPIPSGAAASQITPPQQDLARLELPAGKTPAAPVDVEQKPAAAPATVPATPQVQPKASEAKEQIIKSQASPKVYKHQQREPQTQGGYYYPTMTPDMHTGRRFINLTQEASRGNIVLPIRGERVIKSVDEQKFDTDEAQKVKELDTLINQIKSKETVQKQIVESQRIQGGEEEKRQRLEEQTRKDKELALKSAEEERTHAEKETQAREQVAREQERLQKLRDQEEELRRQKEEFVKKQEQDKQQAQKQKEETPTPPQPQPIPLQPAPTEESPTTPNIIWGTVVTMYQNNKVPVPGAVAVIKNQRGEVVRAVKTSTQGKFGITTPLINGLYTVEVDKEKRSGLNFAITAVEAKGELIPTLEIVGKA